jgi:hypothetical protein
VGDDRRSARRTRRMRDAVRVVPPAALTQSGTPRIGAPSREQ